MEAEENAIAEHATRSSRGIVIETRRGILVPSCTIIPDVSLPA